MTPQVCKKSVVSDKGVNDVPVVQIFALGNGTEVLGMNQRLLPWLKARKGQRFGVISTYLLALCFLVVLRHLFQCLTSTMLFQVSWKRL